VLSIGLPAFGKGFAQVECDSGGFESFSGSLSDTISWSGSKDIVYSFLKECHILLGEELADVVSGRFEVRIGGHISRKYIYPSSEIDGRVWEPRGRGDLEGVET
jgi:hypothetical protein